MDLLDNFGAYRNGDPDGFQAVIDDLRRGNGWTDGANWVLICIRNNAADLSHLKWIFKRDKLVDQYSTTTDFVEKMLDEVRNIGLGQPIIDRFVGRANAPIDELLDLLRSKNVFVWQ